MTAIKVENKLMNTHGAAAPDVGKNVTDLQTSVRTLAEANRKGVTFKSLASRFYPEAAPKADLNV